MAPGSRQNYARTRTKSYAPDISVSPKPVKHDPMPSSSRYLHNLKVIQRHDPTIISLFDQFPHVCVYHHKEDGWQKKGVEGAMFLFEREEEPKYGFYILNRNNTGDYIQRMTPDDDVELANAYLIYRAYGKVTSDTIGLWTMVTQERDAMSEVMMRLHKYIKRGDPYPAVYRRNPETWATTPVASQALAQGNAVAASSLSDLSDDVSSNVLTNLLAKLGNSYTQTPEYAPPPRTTTSSVPPPSTGVPLLDTIFASASQENSKNQSPVPNSLQALFVNAKPNGVSSSSASSAATPTQHMSRLPSPIMDKNGINKNYSSISLEAGILPHPKYLNGKAPNSSVNSISTLQPNGRQSKSRTSYCPHLMKAGEEGAGSQPAVSVNGTPRNRSKHSKMLEKKQQHETITLRSPSSEEPVEWPLVDDRSISLDDEHGEVKSSLGDGIVDAIAALSEAEKRKVNGSSPPVKKVKGRDRRRRKVKEEERLASQSAAFAVQSSPSPGPPEVADMLMNAYGRRRRVEDPLLTLHELKKELTHLINHDSTFMKELHKLYLQQVNV